MEERHQVWSIPSSIIQLFCHCERSLNRISVLVHGFTEKLEWFVSTDCDSKALLYVVQFNVKPQFVVLDQIDIGDIYCQTWCLTCSGRKVIVTHDCVWLTDAYEANTFGDTVSIEIKPKQGWLSVREESQGPVTDLCHRCLRQYAKLDHGQSDEFSGLSSTFNLYFSPLF